MNSLRAGKYSVRVVYILVEILIILVVAGPAAGFLTSAVAPQSVVGFGIDVQAISPQMQQMFSSSSSFVGSHQITVPVYDKWFFPATASLSLALLADGQVVYQAPTSTVSLGPFQSGQLVLNFQISQDIANQMSGRNITVSGTMSFGAPPELWNFKVNFG